MKCCFEFWTCPNVVVIGFRVVVRVAESCLENCCVV